MGKIAVAVIAAIGLVAACGPRDQPVQQRVVPRATAPRVPVPTYSEHALADTPGIPTRVEGSPATLHFPPGEVQVLHRTGDDSGARIAYQGGTYRLLVKCWGSAASLTIVDSGVAASVKPVVLACDGYPLDAQVYSAAAARTFSVRAPRGAAWDLRVGHKA